MGEGTAEDIYGLLVADIIVLLLLCALIFVKIVRIWLKYRRNIGGSKLHYRFSLLFGLIAIIPAIITTLFSALLFHYGVQNWFNKEIKTALDESLAVAQSYMREHQQLIGRDARLMATDLNKNREIFQQSEQDINDLITLMASVRNFKESIVFDAAHNILGRSNLTIALEFEVVPQSAIDDANRGEVALLNSQQNDRMRALIKLDGYPERYLYVGRFVDQNVLKHMTTSEGVVRHYNLLKETHAHIEMSFILVFVLLTLLILMASIMLGLRMADRLVRPIEELIGAAEKMGAGALHIRVNESGKTDELSSLLRSFNQMGHQLESQQQALLFANDELEGRRRFIESVLRSVSSGIISLNDERRIKLWNISAEKLLKTQFENLKGQVLTDIFPEISPLFEHLRAKHLPFIREEVSFEIDGNLRTFLMSLLVEHTDQQTAGYVLTLEDVTDLIATQKKAAWADLARRIAHEVKNPLTPIQLVTERLKSKFGPQIQQDKEKYGDYTQTILKYVNQIRSLIDAFSKFARLPDPVMTEVNVGDVCQRVVDLTRHGYPTVEIALHQPEAPIMHICDHDQLLQVLTNVLKNGCEALKTTSHPEISLSLISEKGELIIEVCDNGPGFPEGVARSDLLKPYVTHSENGTGLGLAIVKRIMDDHGGSVELLNNRERGGTVKLVFPKRTK